MDMTPNILVDLVSLATALVVLGSDLVRSRHARGDTARFRALLSCVSLIFVFDALGWMLDGGTFPGARPALYAINTVYYALQIVYCWLWVLFTRAWTGDLPRPGRALRLLCAAPMLAELVILALNLQNGWVFSLDARNVYCRGPGYFPNLVPYLAYIAAALALSVRAYMTAKGDGVKRQSVALCVYMALPLYGAVMESLNYGMPWTWPFAMLSLLLVYMSVQQKRIMAETLRAAALETELTRNRTAIMLSQIQPHFLYNALTAIQRLCDEDPQTAKRATGEFADFLRGNMNSLTQDKLISFEMELDHTKHYLTLEQYRFQERLHVIYDIETTLFRLPTLTLQPIVENAVRYGVTKRPEGGTVTIAARETAEAYTVTVTDDGVGYDPDAPKPDGRTHIGIDNVRKRLSQLAGGTLEIRSAPGRGTVATLTIPKRG